MKKRAPSIISDGQYQPEKKASKASAFEYWNYNDVFMDEPHINAMIKRNIVLAPLVMHWRYHILDVKRFRDWLITQDIIFSQSTFSTDKDLTNVCYGGTYFSPSIVASSNQEKLSNDCKRSPQSKICLTVWGCHSENAMIFMNSLFNDRISRRSIIQNDLLQFIKELKNFIKKPYSKYFSENVLISASAPYTANAYLNPSQPV